MKVKIFCSLIAVLALLLATPAMASTLNWTVTGTGISGSGTLTTGTQWFPGIFGIVTMDGTFADTGNGISGAVTLLGSNTGGTETSADGLYYYDNLINWPPSGLLFDSTGGVLFSVGGGPNVSGGAEVNVAGIGGGYQLWETTSGQQYLPSSGTGYSVGFAASVPEPMTLSLIGGGLLGLGFLRRRQRRT